MALYITSKCINCDMCAPECPNGAIAMKNEKFQIDRTQCTECVGYLTTPACQRVCPIPNAILPKRSRLS